MADEMAPPTLLYVVGPPAVGKMTVGQEIAARTGLRVLHNHQTIDLVLPFFEFGSPPFGRLVYEFRRRLIEEIAASALPGLIFTFVWAFDQPGDQKVLEQYAEPFRARGGRVLYVELEASQQERLRRNLCASRLDAKPSKRDLEASRRNLLELDAKYCLSSGGQFDARDDYLRLDTTNTAADQVAERVIDHFQLTRQPGARSRTAGTGRIA